MSEQPEVQPLKKFTIDLGAVDQMREELKEKMTQLHEQISKLISKVVIDDEPVLVPIFNLTHQRRDLEKIARALTRVAPIMEEFEKLGKRRLVLDIAAEEPGWLAATLGDFSGDFAEADAFDWGVRGAAEWGDVKKEED